MRLFRLKLQGALLACQVVVLAVKGAHAVIFPGAEHLSALHPHILHRLLSSLSRYQLIH